jgi:hypothetical protein
MLVRGDHAMNKYIFLILIGTACVFAMCGQAAANDAFFNYCKAVAQNTDDPRVVKGMDNWFFFNPELAHLSKKTFWGKSSVAVSSAKKPEWADPLPAIVDFNEQLKKKGIELYFLPVPAKAIVYPDMLKKTFINNGKNRLDYFHYKFYKLLRAKGVNVIDLLPLLLDHRNDKSGPLYCKTDTHWSGLACELVAETISKEIKKKDWYKDIPKLDSLAERKSIYIAGDLVDAKAAAKEEIKLRYIGLKKDKSIVPPRDDSPVVLLGDSHTLVFHEGGDMYAAGAGLADQLAYELGFAVDLIGVRGSGSTASRVNFFRKSKQDPDYLSHKKAVVWCISVREFTESIEGWRLVPIISDK